MRVADVVVGDVDADLVLQDLVVDDEALRQGVLLCDVNALGAGGDAVFLQHHRAAIDANTSSL